MSCAVFHAKSEAPNMLWACQQAYTHKQGMSVAGRRRFICSSLPPGDAWIRVRCQWKWRYCGGFQRLQDWTKLKMVSLGSDSWIETLEVELRRSWWIEPLPSPNPRPVKMQTNVASDWSIIWKYAEFCCDSINSLWHQEHFLSVFSN